MILSICSKKVELFPADVKAPLVVYHAFAGEGETLAKNLQAVQAPACHLAVINDVAWDDEMTPWPIPPITPKDTPCGGTADAYLPTLTAQIVPGVLAALPEPPTYISLAGYSLAGLFSLYAGYRSDLFERIASASGSFWYPGLVEYIQGHALSPKVKCAVFSLGDRESKTRNPYLAPVAENTQQIVTWLRDHGTAADFSWNPGNHYSDATGRMAKAIKRMLEMEDANG